MLYLWKLQIDNDPFYIDMYNGDAYDKARMQKTKQLYKLLKV